MISNPAKTSRAVVTIRATFYKSDFLNSFSVQAEI